MILTRKYVYHPYQVYHGTAVLGTRTFQSVSLLYFSSSRRYSPARQARLWILGRLGSDDTANSVTDCKLSIPSILPYQMGFWGWMFSYSAENLSPVSILIFAAAITQKQRLKICSHFKANENRNVFHGRTKFVHETGFSKQYSLSPEPWGGIVLDQIP